MANHLQTGCGEPITLHTPAVTGQALTAAALGESRADPVLTKAAAHHVHWLSAITCESIDAPHQTETPSASTYLNWSGYIASSSGTPNYVQGLWTEPSVSVPAGVPYAESVIWPGLGGNCSTCQLVQDGTLQEVDVTGQQHFFWIEVWPQEGIQTVTNLVPSAGDSVAADVSWSGGTANFTLCDYTLATCLSGSQSSPAPTNTAEWIVERPTLAGGGYPILADWGSVTITGAGYNIGPGGQLQGSAAGAESATMVNTSGQTLASPGSVSSDGSSFTDTWFRSQ